MRFNNEFGFRELMQTSAHIQRLAGKICSLSRDALVTAAENGIDEGSTGYEMFKMEIGNIEELAEMIETFAKVIRLCETQ